MTRKFLIAIVRVLFWIISDIEVIDREKLEIKDTTIVTANHLGRLDAFLILSLQEFINHPNLVVVVAEKYEQYAIYRWAVKVLDFLFLDRFNPDVRALRKVITRLENDGFMVIAPEGTRSPTAALIEAKHGAAYLASKTEATIIPVSVTGTEDKMVKKKLKRFKRLKITMRIGNSYTAPPLPKQGRSEFLESFSDEIMCQIAAILPQEYRGVYAEKPRLKEILAGATILSSE